MTEHFRMSRLQRIVAMVRQHRPGLILVHNRDVGWMRVVSLAMRPFMPDFMDTTTVVLGDRVYLPAPPERMPDGQLARILAHELVHQLDQARHGAGFYLSYALLPLPAFRTLRAHWERRAYAVDLMLAHHDGGTQALHDTLQGVVRLFCGPAYGWMWGGTQAARAYLQPVVHAIEAGTLQQEAPYAEILAAWTGDPTPPRPAQADPVEPVEREWHTSRA